MYAVKRRILVLSILAGRPTRPTVRLIAPAAMWRDRSRAQRRRAEALHRGMLLSAAAWR